MQIKKQITKSIALYGGAFDPPHYGHMAVLKKLEELLFVSQIWVLPSGSRSDKVLILSNEERFQLLEKLIKKYEGKVGKIKVVDEQIKLSQQLKRMVQTIELLQYFDNKYPSYQFHFVVGSDNFHTINTWERYEKILKEYKFIVFQRVGYEIGIDNHHQLKNQIQLPYSYYLSSFIPPQISSTFVRSVICNDKLSREDKITQIKDVIDELTISLLASKHLL